MRTITTSTGADIALDGDLLAIIETLFQEVTAKRELDRSYEDMMREIRHLISQMSDNERSDYLAESLFHNTVRFENERLASYMEQLSIAPAAEPTIVDPPALRPRSSKVKAGRRAGQRPAKRAAKPAAKLAAKRTAKVAPTRKTSPSRKTTKGRRK
jgi:hypothetical protein